MHKHVETVIGRLATDPALRRCFAADPAALLDELARQGLELTAVEREALGAMDPAALGAFAASLDRRLRRAALATETPTLHPTQEDPHGK